ncbi:MAG: efflux RND transporter periplasmic adaptor subunit [Vulcanimicrobiaceae bacterium]
MKRVNKKIWIGGAVGLAVVVAIVWYFMSRPPATVAQPPAGPKIKMAVAHNGVFVERVTAQGRIGPPAGSDAKLAFPASGTLGTVDVRVGEAVRAGQPLASLRLAGLQIAVSQAQAEVRAAAGSYGGGSVPTAGVASAKAKLSVAQTHLATLQRGGEAVLSNRIAAQSAARQAALTVAADRTALTRQEALFKGGVTAEQSVQAAHNQLKLDMANQQAADAKVSATGIEFKAALRQAQADVALASSDVKVAQAQTQVLGGQAQQAQARLALAQRDLANGILRAPSAGVVLAILKHPGESVDPASPVIDVGPPVGTDVTLHVPSGEARRISVGNPVELNIQPRNERARGHVIAVVPAVDPTTQESTVVVTGVPPHAVSGDAVSATIIVAHLHGLIVPSSALVQDPQSGKTVVFVHAAGAKPGEFTSRAVVVNANDAQTAVIASGLRPGDQIAAQGGFNLLAPSG